jgi:thioredoxin 1
MKTPAKIAIMLLVAAAAVGAVVLKKNNASRNADAGPAVGTVVPSQAAITPNSSAKLPKLVDLGADKCIPCKMMAPILQELKKEYAGRMNVEFIDVWKNPDAGKQYGIEMIPTQVFYDGEGKERFRHVGFFGKEDILGKWKELGVDVSGGKASSGIVREAALTADTPQR